MDGTLSAPGMVGMGTQSALQSFIFGIITLALFSPFAMSAPPTFPEVCEKLHFDCEGGYTYVSPYHGVVRSGDIPFEEIARWNGFHELELQGTFHDVKIRLKRIIQELPTLSREVKQSIIARIEPLTLTVTSHEPAGKYYGEFLDDSYSIIVDQSIIEFPKVNLVNFLAHEITHAFDPGTISDSLIEWKKKLVLVPEASAAGYFGDFKMLAHEFLRQEYGPIMTVLMAAGLTEAQTIEGFPDYIATLVTQRFISEQPEDRHPQLALEGVMDLIVVGCKENQYLLHNRRYPSHQTRLEKIYFANPQIAKWVEQIGEPIY